MPIAKDFVRVTQLMFFGCIGGTRRARQTIICQWLMIFGVIYLWSWYNGDQVGEYGTRHFMHSNRLRYGGDLDSLLKYSRSSASHSD
ncbi:hypothetical protein LSH36_116g05002 [Paralvinella palmiformis]|uniref:Uncharacterized protein n=1 Tax=Paralvinella palmiformis TaxID=53620 RepID=A0AAD9JYW1_9ANNE|nr:hypothetical protein LSH36_116g05002 [Paralvinella palmiformis]